MRTICVLLALLCGHALSAQDSVVLKPAVVSKYARQLDRQAKSTTGLIERRSRQYLTRLQQLESAIAEQTAKTNPALAAELFEGVQARYKTLLGAGQGQAGPYVPTLDSLTTSLAFLGTTKLGSTGAIAAKLKMTSGSISVLQDRLAYAEQVKTFIEERRSLLMAKLGTLRVTKQLNNFRNQAAYYKAQVSEFRSLASNPQKASKKVFTAIARTPVFQGFMRKHGQLASMFQFSGDPTDPAAVANVQGLQTRAQVNQLIEHRFGPGNPIGSAEFHSQMQNAQTQMKNIRANLLRAENGTSKDDKDFKPNSQKVKRLKDRIEIGTNLQSQKGTGYLPNSLELGLSIGYKINDRSIVGVGSSYRAGVGDGIKHFRLSHEGVGIRSFLDWKLKGSFWLSGGYELNYRSAFRSIQELRTISAWQQSGLIGLSKVISVKSKMLKKTKAQLLWDLLSYQQRPVTQHLLFRIGYTL